MCLGTVLLKDEELARCLEYGKKQLSPGAVGLDLDPTDKVFFFADSGSPGSPN